MKNIMVLDVKTTCYPTGQTPVQFIPEVIRIQAIILHTDRMRILEKYHCHIQPTIFPHLSHFCTEFIQIQQQEVDTGISYPEAMQTIGQLTAQYQSIPAFWGYYGHLQLVRQCKRLQVPLPIPKRFITIKHNYSKFYQLKHMKKLGHVLQYHGLESSVPPTDPIADAKKVAKIISILLEEGWEHRYLK
ncbi:inhibitor of KinA sporulation pathway (predicted exonuclease) [Croceifilum oryzae]|uniref:Inhibitor of KinA sporulation pathway (Predicted exonuclease) n=1 Tax=Croceifilum oryzae TaxID=1553429 RepID=A0AAJ1TI61_9BACL|nr:3'-5' exonuclease [Croceifilum oryzae]MDQ0416601.1 inhibitor of KinA sporulation pathway (predicted exonuclease) [Croceifilum oryzae]